MGSESLPLILKRCYVISLFLGREGWVPPQSQQEMCAAGKVWQAQGKAAWCSVAPGLRERERLAVVRWRHRPLSRGESGGCAPAFEALPPTNSGLPISTHCVDPLATPLLPPSLALCLPYKDWPGHFLSVSQWGCVCVWVFVEVYVVNGWRGATNKQ